jgi:hypothetical protein
MNNYLQGDQKVINLITPVYVKYIVYTLYKLKLFPQNVLYADKYFPLFVKLDQNYKHITMLHHNTTETLKFPFAIIHRRKNQPFSSLLCQ